MDLSVLGEISECELVCVACIAERRSHVSVKFGMYRAVYGEMPALKYVRFTRRQEFSTDYFCVRSWYGDYTVQQL